MDTRFLRQEKDFIVKLYLVKILKMKSNTT
jgi:hypothetical protein